MKHHFKHILIKSEAMLPQKKLLFAKYTLHKVYKHKKKIYIFYFIFQNTFCLVYWFSVVLNLLHR